MRAPRVVLLLALSLLSAAAFAADLPHGTISPSENKVPFRLRRGYAIVARAAIGGHEVNVLIDTGANPTVIDRTLARDLEFPKNDSGYVPEIRLGPVHQRNVEVRIRDLRFTKAYLGTRIDAIVGMDVLSVMSFTIDYEKSEIRFGDPGGAWPGVPFVAGPPQATVRVAIGDQQLTLLLDSGTPAMVLFRSRVASSRLGVLQSSKRAVARNLEHTFTVEQAALRSVHIGDTTLPVEFATVSEDWPEWNGTFDGLLGLSATQFRCVSFDLESGMLRWQR